MGLDESRSVIRSVCVTLGTARVESPSARVAGVKMGMETSTSHPYLVDLSFSLVLCRVGVCSTLWRRLVAGWAAALTAQQGRYPLCQVANARIRTGTAQLSRHILDGRLLGCCPVCGGLSHS